MTILKITKFFVFVLVLSLAATTLWAAPKEEQPTAAKKYVTDPTNGKVVTAPEYGGTLTYPVQREQARTDPMHHGSTGGDGGAQELGLIKWGIGRDAYDLTAAF